MAGNVRRRRKTKGLTQEQRVRLGVAVRYVASVEQAEENPR